MKFGICCSPNSVGEPKRLLDLMAEADADYVEWTVGSVMASEAEFEKLQNVLSGSSVKPEAFCSFLPPHHRITGPDVKLNEVLKFASTATKRCRALGAEVIVLGSGGARKVPEGFPMETAIEQFTQFCRELAPHAQEAGITIVIEPLNKSEDNLITNLPISAEIVDAVAHPNIQMLADFYHMHVDNEPLSNIAIAAQRLKHTHLADLGRVAPGYAPEGEADFVGFFRELNQVGYQGRCSFEGKTSDFVGQLKPILKTMRDRYAQAS